MNYIPFVIISILGMVVKLKMKKDSLKDIAEKGNFKFPNVKEFIMDNMKMLVWSILALVIFHVVFGPPITNSIKNTSNAPEPFLWGWVIVARRDLVTAVSLLLYFTISFMGQDFIFSVLNRTSKDLRKAIDYKTTIADQATGTLDTPTPIK